MKNPSAEGSRAYFYGRSAEQERKLGDRFDVGDQVHRRTEVAERFEFGERQGHLRLVVGVLGEPSLDRTCTRDGTAALTKQLNPCLIHVWSLRVQFLC